MSECRRSKRHRKDRDTENEYICPCHGRNADVIAVKCESCGYLCCKSCIYKRFDVSSQRKYNNIIKKNFKCSHCKHNPNEPPLKKRKIESNKGDTEEIEIDNEFDVDVDDELMEFLFTMKVLIYSLEKFKEIQKNYASEIKEREIAISKIQRAEPLTDDDYNNPNIKKNKLWSHFMPIEILKMIFMQTSIDKSVLNIIKVCKNWRDIIHENQNDKQFHQWLWMDCVSRFGEQRPFQWKHLVLIPKQYLKIKIYVDNVQEMDMNERINYRSLVAEEGGDEYDVDSDYMLEWSHDTNIPLLIQILSKCPNIRCLRFNGLICEDIFFVMGRKCKHLQDLSFSFCKGGDNEWFKYLTFDECHVIQTLRTMSIARSYWLNDSACFYFASFKNLAGISSENWWITGNGLYYLFNGCVNLRYIDICNDEDEGEGEWEKAFKCLAEKNKVIHTIKFEMSCIGFNDECLSYLMNVEACPKLEILTLNYHSCSNHMYKYKKILLNIDSYW